MDPYYSIGVSFHGSRTSIPKLFPNGRGYDCTSANHTSFFMGSRNTISICIVFFHKPRRIWHCLGCSNKHDSSGSRIHTIFLLGKMAPGKNVHVSYFRPCKAPKVIWLNATNTPLGVQNLCSSQLYVVDIILMYNLFYNVGNLDRRIE